MNKKIISKIIKINKTLKYTTLKKGHLISSEDILGEAEINHMNQWNNIYTVNWSRRIWETFMQSMYTDERVFQVNGQVNWGKSRFEWLSWFCIDYRWRERVPWFDDSVGKKIRRVLHLIKGNANLRLWPRVKEVLENLKKSVNCKADSQSMDNFET